MIGACVVYDLEYTAWEGSRARDWSGPGEHREIVQIGAVRLDDSLAEVESLGLLVRPVRNPRLSAYFTALTGITQERVDTEGITVAEALVRLDAFAAGLPLLANGTDAEVVAENCRLHGCSAPFLPRCRNIHPLLVQASGRPGIMSAELADHFGLAKGRGHDALDDARAVAGALRLLQSSSKAFL